MKNSRLLVLFSTGCIFLSSCTTVLVSPALQLALTLALVVGKHAAETAAFQTVEACMDEIVRPLIRKAMGTETQEKVGNVELNTDDPKRGKLRGKFVFSRLSPEPKVERTMGEIDLVRDTLDSEWIYDPAYIRLMKLKLGADKIGMRQTQ